MSSRTISMTDALSEYVRSVTLREPLLLHELREETAKLPQSNMQISPEQGQLMRLLTELHGTRRALEVGVFTGYSSLSVALAMPDDGRITACDVSDEWTSVARRYWKRAGVQHKIDLRLAPALETLDALLAEGRAGHFDFAFIDADKSNYDGYYERCLELLRAGGLIAIDNVLWGGAVVDPTDQDADTRAIRALNEKIGKDERVTMNLIPIGDGLMLVRKRG
jgi:predicted O-methyltransferase YrrM